MYQTPDTCVSYDRRAGIALVVVLGFLTVLVLIGISFAIVMRTERMASRAHADSVRAKHMAQVGLARAMQAIEDQLNLTGAIYPEFTTTNYPDTLVSGTSAVNATVSMLSTYQTRRFLPLAVWQGANAPTNKPYPMPRYEYITDPDSDPPNKVIGRYAYIVLNCSGLIDANYIGGMARSNGVNPKEMVINRFVLPEITAAGTNNLPSYRDSEWIRFESLPDVLAFGRSSPNGFLIIDTSMYQSNYIPGGLPALDCVSNLFFYSRAPEGWFDGTTLQTNIVYVGSNYVEADVQAALAAADMAGSDAAAVADCLVDYTDANFKPESTANFTTEPTPLINEIWFEQWVTNTIVGSTTTYFNVVQPRIELWYPFVGVNNPISYGIRLKMNFSNCQPASFNPKYGSSAGGVYQWTTTTPIPGPWTTPRFVTLVLPAAIGSDTIPPVDFSGMQASIEYFSLHEGSALGFKVDSVTPSIDMGFAQTVPNPARVGGVAVVDPRLNYLNDKWIAVGWGTTNAITTNKMNSVADPASGDGIQATNIYIANRPLRNTGEIGLLMAGTTPWRTVPLLGSNAWPILDRFSILTNRTYRGRVNVNTVHSNVLATALYQAEAGAWPGSPDAISLSVTSAFSVAQSFIASGPYDRLSQIKSAASTTGTLASFTALESEGIIRTTADLLTVRQQMYTIIAQGEYLDASSNTAALAKCVAVVWRDPFPNSSGGHENFVRFFRWLGSLE